VTRGTHGHMDAGPQTFMDGAQLMARLDLDGRYFIDFSDRNTTSHSFRCFRSSALVHVHVHHRPFPFPSYYMTVTRTNATRKEK
jgi:hypothetical protein